MITIEQQCEYNYPTYYFGKLSLDLSDEEYESFKKLSFEEQCEFIHDNAELIRNETIELDIIEVTNKSYPIKIKHYEK